MPMMDLKSKHASWLGNICQKFETICHEVDNIVSQETVKYVENQVQSMGQNMKRFYSDVFQDFVPLVDPLRVEAHAVLSTNAAIDTYCKSKLGMEKHSRPTAMSTQSSTVPSDSDPSMDQSNKTFGRHHLVNQSTPAISRQCVVKKESGSASEKLGSVSAKTGSVLSAEENETKSKSSATEVFEFNSSGKREHFEASFSSEPITYDHENTNAQETGTVHCAYEDPILNAEQNEIKSQLSATKVLELNTSGERESFEASFSSELIGGDCENTNAILDEDSAATSFHGDEFQSLDEARTICDDLPDDFYHGYDNSNSAPPSEMAFSIVSSDEKLVEMDFVSFMSHVCTESHCPPNKSDNSIRKEELTNGNCADDLLSATSLPTVSSTSKVAEKGLASSYSALSLKSLGCSDSASYISDNLNESEMQTIDLSDKVKLEDSCVIVDDHMLHEVSRRTRKLRSYKKKIQDILASKKRLTKEYERLAIWFGDSDMENSQEGSNTPACNNLQIQQINDSDWELL